MLTLPLSGPVPCRPAWEVAALPPLAIGGHLDVAELVGAALHLPAAALQLSLPHQTTLALVTALVTVLDYGLYRLLDSLWPTVWLLLWTPSGLRSAVPHLSAVASRLTLH